ncbi:MAG TPA: sigma-70 family RNA polymerase sigma factor [Acidimicrobiia bacterium]|nr:sigma-70 family RNA polymerase sigma factor [Acidimicrobiia bacterium]
MGPRSDADVMGASIRQPAEFGEIFDRHGAAILRFLVRRVGPEAAEQLLGDTFRVAFERRVTFDPDRDSAAPWLYGIATNLLRRHRRSEGRRLRATARLAAGDDGGGADEDRVIAAADAEALLPAVADAVLELPDAERDVLLLFAWEELGYDDIAAALDIPVGTVRSRLNRGRQKVRELLLTHGEEEVTAKEGARRDR